MKNKIRKYCNLKTAVVLLLLVSFNLVAFGREINDCCNKQSAVKKSCCMKKTDNNCSSKEQPMKSCGDKKAGKNCNTCNYEKNDSKNEGTVNSNNNIKTESEISVIQSVSETGITQITKPLFINKYPPGIRTKLFLNISSLLI